MIQIISLTVLVIEFSLVTGLVIQSNWPGDSDQLSDWSNDSNYLANCSSD